MGQITLKARQNWRWSGIAQGGAQRFGNGGSRLGVPPPRRVGAQMVVSGDGQIEGSVSGGCVEGAVMVEAMDALDSGKGTLLEFGVSDGDAFAVGLGLRRHHQGLWWNLWERCCAKASFRGACRRPRGSQSSGLCV